MFIIYGTYHFKKQITGTRMDFCNACLHETRTELVRAFRVGHVYYIPFLPLGWHAQWVCTACGADPRARYQTSPGFWKFVGGFFAALFLFLAVLMWLMTDYSGAEAIVWSLRFVFPALAAGIIYLAFVRPTAPVDVLHDDKRRLVTPHATDKCLYCDGLLNSHPYPYCPHCRIRVYGTFEKTSNRVPGTESFQ
jgi:hypothetical protein